MFYKSFRTSIFGCSTTLLILLLSGMSCALAEETREALGNTKMREVTTEDGFKYFSGNDDRWEFPTNFITIYTHKQMEGMPTLTIIGNNIDIDYPISKIDEALSLYRCLVLQKWEKRGGKVEK